MKDMLSGDFEDIILDGENSVLIKNTTNSNDLLRAIMEKGIEIENFEPYEPSLNDIFIDYVGDENEHV